MSLHRGDKLIARVTADGHLALPPEAAVAFDLTPGTEVVVTVGAHTLSLSRPFSQPAKIYLELTNQCNLNCPMCMRQAWNEASGEMTVAVFERLLNEVRTWPESPQIFFGGQGEPLSHRCFAEWAQQVKEAGASAGVITNGVYLSAELAAHLVTIGMDEIWVSLDSTTPEGYAPLRPGAELTSVLDNLARLRDLRDRAQRRVPRLGLVFVAMRRNLDELAALLRLGERLGVAAILVTNLLPYSAALQTEILYQQSMYATDDDRPLLILPRLDYALAAIGSAGDNLPYQVELVGVTETSGRNSCPFVHSGSVAIRWDGAVSPCVPLLHTHTSYLDDRPRRSYAYTVGHLFSQDLLSLWQAPGYRAWRQRVTAFDFAFCTVCNSCDLAADNRADCFGNDFPTCSGCLWAQGFIRCP